MSRRRRRRRGRWFDDLALNLFALAWLGRAVWRVWRGRAPWQAVKRASGL